MKKFEDVCYFQGIEECLLDIYLPDNTTEFPVFLYFHGGGLEGGSYKDYEYLAKDFTSNGVAFISAGYRKYPKAKYPDFIVDAANAVKWTFDNIEKYGKCRGIYVGGSSAGAYLSMMLCFDRRYLDSVGVDRMAVSGYYHDAGQPTSHYNYLREKGIDTRRVIVDESAPLFYVGLEESYPPMHFVNSDKDMQNRPEQTTLILSTLKHFGFDENTYTNTVTIGTHCEHTRKIDENGQSVFALMVMDFLKKKGAV